MRGRDKHLGIVTKSVNVLVPYCPRDDEPPMINAAWPLNCVRPPSSQGAGRSIELAPGPCAHIPVTTVARQVGTDAALSNVIFSGICT